MFSDLKMNDMIIDFHDTWKNKMFDSLFTERMDYSERIMVLVPLKLNHVDNKIP